MPRLGGGVIRHAAVFYNGTHIMISKRRRMRVNANMIKLGTEGGTCRSLEESREDMIELSGQKTAPRLPPHSRAFFLVGRCLPFSTPAQSLSLARKSTTRHQIPLQHHPKARVFVAAVAAGTLSAIFPFIRQTEAPSLRVGSEMYL
jgi:hypothetical protein